MAQGMQVFDENGNVLIDTSTYVGNFINSFTTTQKSGSITNSLLSSGNPFAFATSPAIKKTSGATFVPSSSAPIYPVITISGNTLSWSWDEDDAVIPDEGITIQYGVF